MHAGPITPIGSASTIEASPNIPHGTLWVEFFAGADGAANVVPTGGTIAFAGRLPNDPGYTIALTGSPMTASSPQLMTWSGPLEAVVATPASVTGNGVTHYRLWVEEFAS